MQRLNLKIVDQIGHTCKVTALSSLDLYLATKHHFEALPFFKNSLPAGFPIVSMRQVAKKFGSVQGELLEIKQVQNILNDIGYEAEIINFQDNIKLFRHTVAEQISKGHPLMVSFAVDINNDTDLPVKTYSCRSNGESNEHGALITGYDPNTENVEMIYWGNKYVVPLQDLFDSISCLPEEREPEHYQKNQDPKSRRKYLFVDKPSAENDFTFKKSINPEKGSGFKAKLIIVNDIDREKIILRRKAICYEMRDSLIDYSIKQIIKNLPVGQKKIAIAQGKIYKESIKSALNAFDKNSDIQQLKNNIKDAEKTYCEAILGKDFSISHKVERVIKMIFVNLATHLLGLITCGIGFYFNYQHKAKTGNWLFLSAPKPEQTLKSINIEMSKRFRIA
jgi:hypothetical protein